MQAMKWGVGLLWLACAAAWGAGYDYATIRVEGGLATQAAGISASGTVVGSYQQPRNQSVLLRPFVYRDGAVTTIKSAEPVAYTFDDINDHGHLVTNVAHRDFTSDAALLRGTQKTPLAVPGAVVTRAYALNDLDLVAGTYDHDPDQYGILATSGYLWSESNGFTTFDMSGAARLTVAWGVNEGGVAVGVYADAAGVYHGFVRSRDGSFTTLDVPGSPYTQLMGINRQGDIVGFYQDPADYVLKGFLYRAGEFQTISPPDAAYGSYPYRVTNDGRVVGWYIDSSGVVLSFLATPR